MGAPSPLYVSRPSGTSRQAAVRASEFRDGHLAIKSDERSYLFEIPAERSLFPQLPAGKRRRIHLKGFCKAFLGPAESFPVVYQLLAYSGRFRPRIVTEEFEE